MSTSKAYLILFFCSLFFLPVGQAQDQDPYMPRTNQEKVERSSKTIIRTSSKLLGKTPGIAAISNTQLKFTLFNYHYMDNGEDLYSLLLKTSSASSSLTANLDLDELKDIINLLEMAKIPPTESDKANNYGFQYKSKGGFWFNLDVSGRKKFKWVLSISMVEDVQTRDVRVYPEHFESMISILKQAMSEAVITK
ncbi:MAG: hypothetical protein AAFV25_03520 [Bacteroidota bacterium]